MQSGRLSQPVNPAWGSRGRKEDGAWGRGAEPINRYNSTWAQNASRPQCLQFVKFNPWKPLGYPCYPNKIIQMLPSVQNEERSHLGCMKVEKAKQQRDGRGWGVWNGSKYKWNWRQNNKENKWKACTSSFVENAWKATLARYLHSGLCKIFGRR